MTMKIFYILFFGGFVKLIKSSSMLMSLLSLEMMASSIMLYLSLSFYPFISNEYEMVVFITLIILEGILGISIFVTISRFKGNDTLKSNNLLKL